MSSKLTNLLMLTCLPLTAFAEGAEVAQTNLVTQFVPLLLIAVMFYFLLIRPQSKRQKEHRQLISNIQEGDEVVVGGGILGSVAKMNEQFIVLKVDSQTELTVQRGSVVQALPKGTLKSIN